MAKKPTKVRMQKKIAMGATKKERTTGNPKSKIGKKAAAQNKKNMKKGY